MTPVLRHLTSRLKRWLTVRRWVFPTNNRTLDVAVYQHRRSGVFSDDYYFDLWACEWVTEIYRVPSRCPFCHAHQPHTYGLHVTCSPYINVPMKAGAVGVRRYGDLTSPNFYKIV